MEHPSNYYKCYRSEITPFLPDRYENILEIGCGEGAFRDNLFKKNEYWGIEPNNKASEKAKYKLDKVFNGKYDDFEDKLPDNYFNLIICNDVIEHMDDYNGFLCSIKKKLTPEGYLVLSIPNVRFAKNLIELLVKKDWKYKDAGILDRTHLRFFTKKSIIELFKFHNYEIKKMGGINIWKPKNIFIIVLYSLAKLILGSDIQYLQYCLKVKK